MASDALKLAWFRRGAHAIGHVADGFGDTRYVCPLCLSIYTEDKIDLLSFEHAPPESVGGARIALTCRECNSTAGSQLDAHLHREHVNFDFVSGKGAGMVRVTVLRGGTELRGDLYFQPDGLQFVGQPKANDPAEVERSIAAMDDVVPGDQEGGTFQFRLHGAYNPRRARMAWVRAAYVAAFAQFGYRYALRPVFDALRAQFQDPDSPILEQLPILTNPNKIGDEMDLSLAIIDPSFLSAIAVQMGARTVFLPGEGDIAPGFFDDIASRLEAVAEESEEPGRFQLNLPTKIGLRWPSFPQYVYDG